MGADWLSENKETVQMAGPCWAQIDSHRYVLSPPHATGHATKACFRPFVHYLLHLVLFIIPSHVEPDSGVIKETGQCGTFPPLESIDLHALHSH